MGRPSNRGGVRNLPPTAPNAPAVPPAFKGQPYGTGVQQLSVAQAAPQGAAAAAPQGPQGFQATPGAYAPPPNVPAPGEFPPLLGPTERPNEPVTSGLPFGPGPNSLPTPFQSDPLVTAAALLANLPAIHMTPQLTALLAATRGSVANSSGPSVANG